MSLAQAFFTLFAGLNRSYGHYVVPMGAKPTDKGKMHDTKWARTVHGTVTVQLWEEHLKGVFGLGIVPIRDDSTCVFGACDIDIYPLDLVALTALIKKLGLPLITCRTKSGGAHLYLFLNEAAPAELVRSKLMEWAVRLGFPGIEIFPKQTKLASENDDGSWINMPYQSGKRSTRYAIKDDGSAMTPEEFVKAANAIAISPDTLSEFQLPPDEVLGEDFAGGPPCLETLGRRGFGDWHNNGLFNIAVFLRKKYGDGWEKYLDDYNEKYIDPPVNKEGLDNIKKSVNKKAYSFMCKQEPICGVCNRQVCVTREFGVGGSGDDPGVVFGELLKIETDPEIYIWDVNGARIEISVDDLLDQRKMRKIIVRKLNILTNYIKENSWMEIIRTRLDKIVLVKVPEDATKEGQFWVHVQRFCTSKVKGRSMDELLLGKPYTENGRTYFCSADLFQYLNQHRFAGASEKDVFKWMRSHGVEHHSGSFKGKFLNYWSIPSFPEQTEEHNVPRLPAPEKM